MENLINDYIKEISRLEKVGEKLCKKFEEILKPIIPDIEVVLGADTICFESMSHNVFKSSKDDASLSSIVSKIYPELTYYIDDPYGVYLNKEEEKKVREALKKNR